MAPLEPDEPDESIETVPCVMLLGDIHPVRRGELIALCDAEITIGGVVLQLHGLQSATTLDGT